MVVTGVQDFIAAGQFRGGEQLIDAQQVRQPGTITVMLEPLFAGGIEDVTPGSSCIANAYSNYGEGLNFTNAVAQGKIKQAFRTLDRVLINTTIGVGGLAVGQGGGEAEVEPGWHHPWREQAGLERANQP
jgi:hypothetical protein